MIDTTQPERTDAMNLIPLVDGGILIVWDAPEVGKATICFAVDGKKWRLEGAIKEVK